MATSWPSSGKGFLLGTQLEIYRDGQVQAVVKKSLFTFLRCTFTVDVPGPDDLEATGSLTDHEYRFERHGDDRRHGFKALVRLERHLRRRHRARRRRRLDPGGNRGHRHGLSRRPEGE